jgi:hypothetical protein
MGLAGVKMKDQEIVLGRLYSGHTLPQLARAHGMTVSQVIDRVNLVAAKIERREGTT